MKVAVWKEKMMKVHFDEVFPSHDFYFCFFLSKFSHYFIFFSPFLVILKIFYKILMNKKKSLICGQTPFHTKSYLFLTFYYRKKMHKSR